MNSKTENKEYVRAYFKLRRAIGIIGIALPVVLLAISLVKDHTIIYSISQYYHYTGLSRNIFIGTMTVLGIFMFFYVGYPDDGWDNIFADVAAFAAFGVAFSPSVSHNATCVTVWQQIGGYIHVASALLLFTLFIIFSGFRFTKSSGDKKPQKKTRNAIYSGAAIAMTVLLVSTVVVVVFGNFFHVPFFARLLNQYYALFFAEFLLLVIFGFSWLVKGGTLFKDKA